MAVWVERVAENIFKIIFGCKEDRDRIFRNRPWSLDGAYLILKLWPDNLVMNDILFDANTLWLQIHGLPPAVMQEGTAEKIGNRVGKVHLDTINRQCVVAHYYLWVRVKVQIKDPFPAGFFYA